jgi:glycerophosphoryl diester phosphodiesterase
MIILICLVIIIITIVIYLIKPNKKRVDKLPSQLFAHRGLHGRGVPENSLAAFQKAREKGLGVELDVRFTSDKKVVVFHDDTLERLCGQDIKVNEITYEELQNYRLSNTNEKIPLLLETLQVLDDMPVICEIKSNHTEPSQQLCEAVNEEIKSYKGFICVESFDPYVVKWFRENNPDILRGQLSMNFLRNRSVLAFLTAFAMTNLLINALSRPDFIAYRYKDDSFGYFLCRHLFNPICVPWTIIGESEIKKATTAYNSVIFEE